jgi:pyruvate kinase
MSQISTHMAPPNHLFAKTKIVCTIGPSSRSLEMMTALIRVGMDVARLNFSHGTRSDHIEAVQNIREASRITGETIAVIQDLQGPKIRIGQLSTETVELLPEQTVTITTRDIIGDARQLSTTYRHFPQDVKPGDRVLLDDGRIELRVERIDERDVVLRVIVGGALSAHKGINLPGVAISAPSFTEKDKEDLLAGFDCDVDYVALSFVRRADDVASLRSFIVEHARGRKIPIIAKIEKVEAISNIDEILKETDAVMVARGDLGVELPAEDVPLLQKMIVRKCNEAGKPVIIATQMLESMIQNPAPTRAEASDVANAVLDGADAVMLSAETSIGQYPRQSVMVMDRIIRKTEDQAIPRQVFDPDRVPITDPYDPLSRSACMLANDLRAPTIVVLTHTGSTARHVAKFRPHARIIAVTDQEQVARRLNLVWGIRGFIVEDLKKDTDVAFKQVQSELLKGGYIGHGNTVVMLAGIPLFEGHPTNTIKVDVV